MSHHSILWTDKELSRTLRELGIDPHEFNLAHYERVCTKKRGIYAGTRKDELKIYGAGFVAVGFMKKR